MSRGGVALVVVLVVIAVAAMAAASLLVRATADTAAAAARTDREQAAHTALSGLRHVMTLLQTTEPAALLDDQPDLLAGRVVDDDGTNPWCFTAWSAAPDEPTEVRYALGDEAARLNLNVVDEQALSALDRLTPEQIAALLDYRDRDDNPRPAGAEQNYYGALPEPYRIANAPFTSVEELLMVRGFTAAIVYGEDANLNDLLDPAEQDGDDRFPPDDRDGELDRGLVGLFTVYSSDPDVDSTGEPRIDLNANRGLDDLGLSDQTLEFVELVLAEGNRFEQPADLLEAEYELTRDHPGRPRGTVIRTDLTRAELVTVMDRLTTRQAGSGGPGGSPGTAGLVNVNTAPAAVLAAVDGIDPSLASSIEGARGALEADEKATLAWVYNQALVDAETFQRIAPRLTSRSRQHRVRIVGYAAAGGAQCVYEGVIDTAGRTPRLLRLRELTRLGPAPAAVTGPPQSYGRGS